MRAVADQEVAKIDVAQRTKGGSAEPGTRDSDGITTHADIGKTTGTSTIADKVDVDVATNVPPVVPSVLTTSAFARLLPAAIKAPSPALLVTPMAVPCNWATAG